MIETILFYGFVVLALTFSIYQIFVKDVLRKNGYDVAFIDIDFSDYKNLHSLAKKQKKYNRLYFGFILLTFLPILIVVLFVLIWIFIK
jgi:hypothetical protein